MFSKKPHSDIKKSSQKVLDSKKDSLSRLKHLRIVLENSDNAEAKAFFESNYSHIYYILYDVFISVENNLKQRAHNRTHREELDVVRYIFEKLLLLLPELLSRRWQCHSIQRIMKKFLHCGNSTKLRREGIRLFVLWYQIVGDNSPDELDSIFATLVPGIIPGLPNPYLSSQNQIHSHSVFRAQSSSGEQVYTETSTFYTPTIDDSSPVCPGEILPLLPPLSGEQQPEDVTRFYLDCVMEFMVSQVCKIEWKEKSDFKYQRCFCFLFEKFKKYYLPHIFPSFSACTSLYIPSSAIPGLRYASDIKMEHDTSRFAHKDTLQHCQSVVVRWVTHFTQCLKKSSAPSQQPVQTEQREQNDSTRPTLSTESENSQSTTSLLSTTSVLLERDPSSQSISNDELSFKDYTIVRETLYNTRENINLIQEIFRQAFLMPFNFASTMRKVVAVYREWIHKNSTDKPLFLDEPVAENEALVSKESHRQCEGNLYSVTGHYVESADHVPEQEPMGLRLRKDSYLKAIHSDHNYLKAGLQNMLRVFISNAANVFLLDISSESVQLLEEQVDMCKRVLNIYRYMVMNVPMERRVWELLLLVLLQITSMVLREVPPVRKEATLGGRLAPALFQTLIVTWIKANLNVIISVDLWDQFLLVLSSLTQWEELIKEWAKTMETLTRVLAKQVYSLDLNDLPLDRLSERKMKKTRGMKKPCVTSEAKFDKSKSYNGHSDVSGIQSCNSFEESSQGTARESYQPATRTRSESGDESQKPEATCDFTTIRKSASDSNLAKKYPMTMMHLQSTPLSSEQKQVLMITGASPSAEDELSTLVVPNYEYSPDDPYMIKQMYARQKSKSLDFLSHRAESPCFSESSDCRSRSPSPTPSSGLENTSIKDSPMQIDVLVSSADNSCNNSEVGSSNCVEAQSVMSGGTTRGWMSDVAVVLWKRMLGALGDINLIKDPSTHAQVLKYLLDLTKLLMKIRDNLGVSLDNQSSPPPPELAPPLLLITPWLFQALNLPDKFKQGKLLACELLCSLSMYHHDLLASMDYLAQFYCILHNGLTSTDQDIVNIIIKSCGPRFFSSGLPGCSLLLKDFLAASKTVISTVNLRMPRTEAVSIVGSLLCFPNVHKNLLALQPSPLDLNGTLYKDAKDRITQLIMKAGKREHSGLGRCIAICGIGIYLYEELMNETYHHRIKEGINVLLAVVGFACRKVAQVSSDMLLLLSDHADKLLDKYPDLLRNIIEVICSTLATMLSDSDAVIPEDDKKFILSLIHCLGEWCMCVHQNFLTGLIAPSPTIDWDPPLLSVLKVLNSAASGTDASNMEQTKPSKDFPELSVDIDPNIQLDYSLDSPTRKTPGSSKSQNNQEKVSTTNENSFFRPLLRQREVDGNHNVVRLAARNVLNHLVNHLGHFPMGIGAVRLTSLITEHDDVPTLTGDELSAEVFHAPNIQFFVLNNCSIISFVEIPTLEMPGGGAAAGLATSQSQVRAIIRDLGGKFSWDCSILYGPPDCCGGSYILEPDIIPCLNIPSQPLSLLTTETVTNCGSPLPDQTLRHRLTEVLPTMENSADDLDNLDDLLQFVGYSSPECVSKPVKALNSPPKLLCEDSREKEMDIMNLILNQRNREQAQFQKFSGSSSMEAKSIYPPSGCENSSPFQYCRLLLNQLGYTCWEKRATCDLLKKNEQLLRELRNLDKQKCRETHKIAVIYVAEGQEDKISILTNCGGSQEFEEFVAGLGWEVELETHLGFLGGLQRNKSTGDTAPYYATSFLEVIFHVSTRMSATLEEESMTRKLRHLGNDEVHIVWSEHVRDYRKEIIATEFCDVLIAIYPIGGRLYRIHISRKSEVPFFGPLFSGAIVEHKVLPGLVRATAINASRAMRSLVSLYQNFYEERFRSLETIVQNHKEKTTFEQFAANVYSPAPTKSHVPNRSSGPPSRTDSTSSRGIPNLAAALLDAQSKGSGYSPNLRSRPVSQSTTECLSQQGSPQVPVRDRPLSASQTHA